MMKHCLKKYIGSLAIIFLIFASSNIFAQAPGQSCEFPFFEGNFLPGKYNCNGICLPSSSVDLSPCSGCVIPGYVEYDPNATYMIDPSQCVNLIVEGCIDESAFNYNSGANTDDGSCISVVEGCIDATAFNYNADANTDDGSCVATVNGCIDEAAFNYNADANSDDGSCEPVVEGCMDETAFNYNSDANTPILPSIGDFYEGGYIFNIDELNESILVAAPDDLGQHEWGCFNTAINGANGIEIGTGLQNTQDILSQGCESENGGLIAAEVATNSNTGGYNDWYLPSRDELTEMYLKIKLQSGNIGNFQNVRYWSSSVSGNTNAWNIHFVNGSIDNTDKSSTHIWVRPIRSASITDGCLLSPK